MGTYPKTVLALARQMAEEGASDPRRGHRPESQAQGRQAAVARNGCRGPGGQVAAASDSSRTLARDWFEVRRGSWRLAIRRRSSSGLERDVFRGSAGRRLPPSPPPMLLEVLATIEARWRRGDGASSARELQPDLSLRHRRRPGDHQSRLRPEGRPQATPAEALRRDHGARAARAAAARMRRLCRHSRGARRAEAAADAAAPTRRVTRRGVERDRPRQGAVDGPCGAHETDVGGQAERGTAPGSLAEAGCRRVARASAVDGWRKARLSGRAASRPTHERQHHQRSAASYGVCGGRNDRSRVSRDGADHLARAARLQPRRDRGQLAHSVRDSWAGLQPTEFSPEQEVLRLGRTISTSSGRYGATRKRAGASKRARRASSSEQPLNH